VMARFVRAPRVLGVLFGMGGVVMASMACGASVSAVPQPPAISLEEIAAEHPSPIDAGKRD
jgi:hypothetical protein